MFSLFLLLILSGLFLVIGFIFLLTSNRPILYVSMRIGKDGRRFKMLKFRTLAPDTTRAPIDRQFTLGRILRFTNLDELPQLWNVLKGEMSLIGPRPLPEAYASFFSKEQNERHRVLPGITGLAQVNGKNDLSWDQKFRFDLEYVNKVSLVLDIKILFKTLIFALSFKKDTSLAEEKFSG